jgi:hypothetical protein
VDEFVHSKWTFVLNPETKKDLFTRKIKREIDTILNQLTAPEDRKILEQVSVFKGFDVSIVGFIGKKSNDTRSALAILASLLQSGLVRPPRAGEVFYSDSIVRNLILVHMRLSDLEGYRRLNL